MVRRQKTDGLERFAEPHVVAQDPVEVVSIQER